MFLPLASIEAIRPVFMIVMGIFLMIIAWRLAQGAAGWTSRMIVGGAFLLGFGYSVVLPLYESGSVERFSARGHYHGDAATAVAWHSVKIVTMNSGWLIFGLGLALHAKVFTPTNPRPKPARSVPAPHESVA